MTWQEYTDRLDKTRSIARRVFDELCIDDQGEWIDPKIVRELVQTVQIDLDCQLAAYQYE